MLKTYDSLSDIFDLTIANKKYVHIAERNAETFWNYKHNYIVNILNSDEKDFDVPWDLKKMEESLIKKEELMKKIPFNLVSKLIQLNYWDVSKDEKKLISYLQENDNQDIVTEIYDFINHIQQDFEHALSQYESLLKWKDIEDLDKPLKYENSPKIKENEYEAREYWIKKWLWTFGNVIINEATNYDMETLAESIWIHQDELENLLKIENKEIIEKLHIWIYRMSVKYKDYAELYKWIAEWKEYEDKALWIKDYSELYPTKIDATLERESIKVPLETYEKNNESSTKKDDDAKESNKSFWRRILDRFK